jgi:trans-aconitate methyltransferase
LTGTEKTIRGFVDRGGTSDYDNLPYLSLPIAFTQPTHLAALAALHGLTACPDPERAHVLELGCASGGNLLPLAARWPKSRFLGVDLSARQIADGNRRINYFHLENVTLKEADLAEFTLPAQSFDYVICHGVFSWVSPSVQRSILGLISSCLSDRGVAAVSYNVLPGWHLRNPVKDIVRYYARRDGSTQERVARARAVLGTLETYAGPGTYGTLLRTEARQLAKVPSSYIHGEFLAEHNHPIQFLDFISAAADHGLEFICEADLDAGARSALTREGVRHVDRLAGRDRVRASQELDFLSGRPFRRTLLRKRLATGLPTSISVAHLSGLHIATRLSPDPKASADGKLSYIDRYDRPVSTRVPIIGKALALLSQAYPATLPVEVLLAASGSARDRVAQALLEFACRGRAVLSALPIRVGRETDPRPKVWRFARAEAALGLPGVTSLHHVTVALTKIGAAIASMADGTRSGAELASWLAAEMTAGRVGPPEAGLGDADADQMLELAQWHVADTLRHLADSAVLAPGAT